MLTKIILVNKNGTVKETNAADVTKETLYKKCGFKKPDDFCKRVEWKVKKDTVEVWARDTGKAGSENKYDFPPPIDKPLYFGACAIILVNEKGEIKNLDVSAWNKIYEDLFGGFEDITVEEEEEEDVLKSIPKEHKTKGGYLKDGFVVDDNSDKDEPIDIMEDDDEDDVEDDAEEDDAGEDVECDEELDTEDTQDIATEEDDEVDDENNNSETELEEEEYNYTDDEIGE